MGTLASLFGRTPRVAILDVFAESPDEVFSVPDIVRETGASKRGVYMHIRKLVDEGVLTKARKEGKCWFYGINVNDRRGQVLPFVESLFTLGRIEREIRRDLGVRPEEPFPHPEYSLWTQPGPVARYSATDLPVVAPHSLAGLENPSEATRLEWEQLSSELVRPSGEMFGRMHSAATLLSTPASLPVAAGGRRAAPKTGVLSVVAGGTN